MKNKKILIVGLILVIILFTFVLVLKIIKTKNNEHVIDELSLTDSHTVSNILFDNIEYIYEEGITTVKMKATNNNKETIVLGRYVIKVYDENDNYLDSFTPTSNYKLKQNETLELEFFLEKDLSIAHHLEIDLPNLEFMKRETGEEE